MKSKRTDNPTWNPNHCPPSTFVKLKELDTLQHLVRKYPDVAMDWLSTVQMVEYIGLHRVTGDVPVGIIRWGNGYVATDGREPIKEFKSEGANELWLIGEKTGEPIFIKKFDRCVKPGEHFSFTWEVTISD